MGELQRPWLATYARLGISDTPPADRSLADYFAEHVRERPESPALHYMMRSWTYAELNKDVGQLANGLAALGVGPGDVVGLHMPNIPQYVMGLLAISALGATGSGVSPLLAPPELAHQIGDAKIKVLLSFDALAPALTAMSAPEVLDTVVICGARDLLDAPALDLPELPGVTVTDFNSLCAGQSHVFDPVTVDPEATFMIQYTGGTTGPPKGAMLSHRTLMHNPIQLIALAPALDIGQEICVSAFPLFHIDRQSACRTRVTRTAFAPPWPHDPPRAWPPCPRSMICSSPIPPLRKPIFPSSEAPTPARPR